MLNKINNDVSAWERTESTNATNPLYQYDLQYKREFKNDKNHTLLFSSIGRFFGKDMDSEFENRLITGDEVIPNQKSETSFYQVDYIWKLDYTNPISEKLTLEAGGMFESNDVKDKNSVFELTNGQHIIDPNFSNEFEYNQKVLGIYGTGSYEGDKIGIKLGLRTETTNLKTNLINISEENTQNYTNLFPTVHSSYKVSDKVSFQAGYSRRIYRPRLWDLKPSSNIRNNFNIRAGNPNLQPEFADSYEMTSILYMGKFYINTSMYHLYKKSVIEYVTTATGNVSTTIPMNLGTSNKTGLELNLKYRLSKKVVFNSDFNFGFFQRSGQFNTQNFDFSGHQWTLNLKNKIKLPKQFDFEGSVNFTSAYKTIQGKSSAFAFVNLGLRKKFKGGKFIAGLNVRDLFASRNRTFRIEHNDYNIYNFSERGRFFTLNLSYSFGKGEAMSYNSNGGY